MDTTLRYANAMHMNCLVQRCVTMYRARDNISVYRVALEAFE